MKTKTRLTILTTVLTAAAASAPHAIGAQQAPIPAPAEPISLGDAARIAARNNAGARVAQQRTVEAQARARQQRAALLPDLTAVGTQGQRTFNTASFGIDFPTAPGQPPLFDPNGQVLGPVQTIDFRGRVAQQLVDMSSFARLRAARTAVRASGAEAGAAAEQAGAVAAAAYVRALRADADYRARNEDSVLAADLLGIARTQLRAGVGIALDVTRAEAQVAATRAQLIASRAARDRSRLELLRALNLPLTTSVALRDTLAGVRLDGLETDPDAAVARALAARPDLRAAEQRVDAARQSAAAVRAERLPTLGVVADRGVNGKSYAHLLNTYQYGFQLSLPVFDGLRREGRRQESEAVAHEAELQRDDLREQTAADIRTALLDLTAAREQVEATRERLRLTEQEVAQARERFSAGVAGNADVITASLSLTASRTALIDALTNYDAAGVALARAEGTVTTLP